MFNIIFVIAVILGFGCRIYDGKIISIALGLCLGVLVNEAWRFIVYLIRSF